MYVFVEVVQEEGRRKGGVEVDHQEEGKGTTVIFLKKWEAFTIRVTILELE